MAFNPYITADLHLGHRTAAYHRGFFDRVEDYNQAVLNMLSRIPDNSSLFILGDLFFGEDKSTLKERLRRTTRHLDRVVVVLGNHDRPHPMNNNSWDHIEMWSFQLRASIVTSGRLRREGTQFNLSHFPYTGDLLYKSDAHTQWRLPDEGTPIIHGHTHSIDKFSLSSKGTPQINVSPDAWGLTTPPRLSDIHQLLTSQPGVPSPQ